MEARINRRTLGVILGGAIVVLFAGASIVDADSSSPSFASSPAISSSVHQSEIAAWAAANGLGGLSPSSLSGAPVRTFGQAEVAAWATANGLSGLSPAGLASVPARSTYQAEVAAWAAANGLTGLSPASVGRTEG